MLKKIAQQNHHYSGPAPEGSHALERDGHYLLRGEYSAREVQELREALLRIYAAFPPDERAGRTSPENAEMFRYELFNRCGTSQEAIARPNVLAILEPLLGDDCHAITCTAWRNPPGNAHAPRGQEWHVDGGPHVPRAPGVAWPVYIPYPIFVVATHVYLQDVELADGPTAFVPGSHTSGRLPPRETMWELTQDYRGRQSVAHVARAGDVGFFVSDIWHRRLPPAPHGRGRFFLQTNYARREIAQRVRPTSAVNHLSRAAIERADTPRKRTLIGLHPEAFYDG